MSPARVRSLALAAALGLPASASAQSPASAPAPTPASAPAPTSPAPAPTSPAPAPTSPAPTPDDVAPVPPAPVAPAPAPLPTPAPAPVVEPIVPAPPVDLVPPLPRLSLTAAFVFGPHSQGEATCQDVEGGYQCEHTGNFLGLGGTLELRAQLYKILFLHARALLVGNVRSRGAHRGLTGGGIGIGAYSRFAFVRAEYMLVPTLGSPNYRPPFYGEAVARDAWDIHAGMVSAGVRRYVSNRASLEAWGGLVIGPHARRTSLAGDAKEDRVLVSFMIGLGFTYDLLLQKGYVPGPYKRRPRRQWGTR